MHAYVFAIICVHNLIKGLKISSKYFCIADRLWIQNPRICLHSWFELGNRSNYIYQICIANVLHIRNLRLSLFSIFELEYQEKILNAKWRFNVKYKVSYRNNRIPKGFLLFTSTMSFSPFPGLFFFRKYSLLPWHSLYKHSLYVTKFIRTFFIQDRFYTGQSLYEQSLYGDKVYTRMKFIRGQSLYGTKFIRWQSLYEDKVYTNFFHTALELKDIKRMLQ